MRRYKHPDSIYKLADIKARCWVDEDSGCWIWRQSKDKDDQGKAAYRLPDGEYLQTTARRIAWILKTGELIAPKRVIYHVRCTNRLCVNPAHLACGTKAEAGQHLRQLGYLRGDPERIVRNTKQVHKYIAKLDWGKVKVIRNSERTREERVRLAEQFGVKPKTVRDVQNYVCWRDTTNSSVFAFRP